MKPDEAIAALKVIAAGDDFAWLSRELVDGWGHAGFGIEIVEPLLRFMEDHEAIDFGAPGPLVHFLETFFGKGYEEHLLESVQRKPTPMTVWMLHRVINGTRRNGTDGPYLAVLQQARLNPRAGSEAVGLIDHFLRKVR